MKYNHGHYTLRRTDTAEMKDPNRVLATGRNSPYLKYRSTHVHGQ